MGDTVSILEKLKILKQYLAELDKWSKISFEEYEKDSIKKGAIERRMQLIVDVTIDINNMILKKLKKETSADYFNTFINLAEASVIEYDFALRIAPSTGLRNILVHQYQKIDDKRVYDSINEMKKDYKEYINEIVEYVKNNL